MNKWFILCVFQDGCKKTGSYCEAVHVCLEAEGPGLYCEGGQLAQPHGLQRLIEAAHSQHQALGQKILIKFVRVMIVSSMREARWPRLFLL